MPGRSKNSAEKQPCYCVICNGAFMSKRTFRRHLNKPQVSDTGNGDRDTAEETSGSDDASDDASLDLDRPTKRARTGGNGMVPVCFISTSFSIDIFRISDSS